MGYSMIGALLSGLFSLILNLLATIVQIVLLPINLLFQGIFPDLSTSINDVVQGFSQALSGLSWAVSVIPPVIRTTLLLILTIEIALFAVLKSTRLTSRLWKILQKIKVW